MVDYDVDKIEVAISNLFNLEVGAELRAKGNKWINGFYIPNPIMPTPNPPI